MAKTGKGGRRPAKKFSDSYLKRKRDAESKRKLARRMLKSKKSNAEIQGAVKKRFGSSIGPDALATIRAELGISGANRGSRKNGKTPHQEALIVLQDNGTSACFRSSLQTILDQMPTEGVQAFAMKADGTVRVQQVREFMLTPPAGADKLGGGL